MARFLDILNKPLADQPPSAPKVQEAYKRSTGEDIFGRDSIKPKEEVPITPKEQEFIDRDKERRYLERRAAEIVKPISNSTPLSKPIEVEPDEVFKDPLSTILNQKIIRE